MKNHQRTGGASTMAIPSLRALAILNAFVILAIPAVFAASSSSSAEPSNPTAPNYTDDVTWLTGYLTIHSLSRNSYVYMFLFWFLVFLVFLALSWATWTDIRVTALGARWSKWALRRRTWRKKHTLKKNAEEARKLGVPVSAVHRQPKSLPSNAEILTAVVLSIIVLAICFLGPDYINPDLRMFDFSSSSSSSSNTKRAKLTNPINDDTVSPFIAHYNIQKAWWTSAARTGGVAFALYPLVIVLALKAPPFAVFGIPGLVQYGHDKMIRLHRYVGRLIWFVTLLHVLFWVVQVLEDRRAMTGKLVFAYVWEYQKFRFAWVAFLSMTILMIFTLPCIRNPHYEAFYIVHVVFTPMTIIFSALHHPQRGVWGWCAAALAIWVGERMWRACGWVYVNGVFGIKGAGTATGAAAGRGRVGSISPYVLSGLTLRAGEKDSGHRPTASRGSATTLTNSNQAHSTKGSYDAKAENEQEQWEMNNLNTLRAPAPRRPPVPPPPLSFPAGYEVEPFGNDTSDRSRRSSILSAESSGNGNGSARLHGDGLTPTPGELMELARVQTGGSTSSPGARGMPLQIQTTPATPTYPPAAHQRYVQSPGAGPGPRSITSDRQGVPPLQQHHRFQPHPMRPRGQAYAPPPGFALATLLPGRTIRLRLVTPGYQTWAPGQHFLVGIPAVSRFTTHPFSVASVCDEQAAMFVDPDSAVGEDGRGDMDPMNPRKRLVQAEAGRELILLVRAKKGWTKRLWDLVSSLQSQGLTSAPSESSSLPSGFSPPPPGTPGVILRTLVDGPFGSAGRTRWGKYSSVLIIAGGSGVSFGLSVLEYVCLCIAGRDGRFLGGYPGGWGVGPKGAWITQRVRFVWLVREYAHIQWCVSSLRRCLTIVPTDALELSIFVTNHRPPKELAASPMGVMQGGLVTDGRQQDGMMTDNGLLKPPAPRFAGGGKGSNRGSPLSSEESLVLETSVDSIVDSYFEGSGAGYDGRAMENELGHETHLLDYTNFDGDDDTPMPGEHRLSRRIIKEGKMRRARSQKVKSVIQAKKELEERVAAAKVDPSPSPYAYAYDGGGHAKSPSDEMYGRTSKRSSAHSTAPLLPYSSPANSTPNSGDAIPSIGTYSSFAALLGFDRHAQEQPQSQSNNFHPQSQIAYHPPPSAFTSFGASGNELSAKQTRRFSASSGSTLNPLSASTPSLTPSTLAPSSSVGVRWGELPSPSPSSTDVMSWSGISAVGAHGSGLALDPQEVRDLQIVSEWARAGKPKLGKIVADEVENAKGRIAVACCGPTSLNALIRKLIAEHTNPERVARGDLRGSIDFIAEDFEY